MAAVGSVIYIAALIYLVLLFARMVIGWIVMLARDYRPHGVALVAMEGVYTLTDPPIKLIRKLIKPIRIGPVQLDVAFMVVVLVVLLVMQLASLL